MLYMHIYTYTILIIMDLEFLDMADNMSDKTTAQDIQLSCAMQKIR